SFPPVGAINFIVYAPTGGTLSGGLSFSGVTAQAIASALPTGGITLHNATLQLAAPTLVEGLRLGSWVYTCNIVVSGTDNTLDTSSGGPSFAAAITGSGALTKIGAPLLTLTGAGSTFNGQFTLGPGGLTVNTAGALNANFGLTMASGTTFTILGNETIGDL